jgi:hypothetical protein
MIVTELASAWVVVAANNTTGVTSDM